MIFLLVHLRFEDCSQVVDGIKSRGFPGRGSVAGSMAGGEDQIANLVVGVFPR